MVIAKGNRVVDGYGREGVVQGVFGDQADVAGYGRVWRVPLSELSLLPGEGDN